MTTGLAASLPAAQRLSGDALLESALGDEAVHEDGLRLPDAVRAVRGLRKGGGSRIAICWPPCVAATGALAALRQQNVNLTPAKTKCCKCP